MIGESFFEEFADYRAFVQRFVVVLESWDEAAGVEGQKGLGFVVGVYFDVLVGDAFLFEDGPGALDEGAAFLEGRVLDGWVSDGEGGSKAGGFLDIGIGGGGGGGCEDCLYLQPA